jgi:hypothetical protein
MSKEFICVEEKISNKRRKQNMIAHTAISDVYGSTTYVIGNDCLLDKVHIDSMELCFRY